MMRAMAARADERARKRLGECVKQRRLHLRLSVVQAALRVGTTNKTWGRVEKGLPVSDLTYANVERSLAWKPGSCGVTLEGGEPTIVEPNALTPEPPEPPELPERIYADSDAEDWLPIIANDLRESVREATLTTAPGLTGAEVQEIERRVEEGLKRRFAERHRNAS